MASKTGKFEIYRDKAKEYRWRFRATNGAVMADSGEGYRRIRNCRLAVSRLLDLIPDADVSDIFK